MKLTQEQIDQFKELYLKRFGVQLTDAQAREKGVRLILLVKAVYEPANGSRGPLNTQDTQ